MSFRQWEPGHGLGTGEGQRKRVRGTVTSDPFFTPTKGHPRTKNIRELRQMGLNQVIFMVFIKILVTKRPLIVFFSYFCVGLS